MSGQGSPREPQRSRKPRPSVTPQSAEVTEGYSEDQPNCTSFLPPESWDHLCPVLRGYSQQQPPDGGSRLTRGNEGPTQLRRGLLYPRGGVVSTHPRAPQGRSAPRQLRYPLPSAPPPAPRTPSAGQQVKSDPIPGPDSPPGWERPFHSCACQRPICPGQHFSRSMVSCSSFYSKV